MHVAFMKWPWLKLVVGFLLVGYLFFRLRALHDDLSKHAKKEKITLKRAFEVLILAFITLIGRGVADWCRENLFCNYGK